MSGSTKILNMKSIENLRYDDRRNLWNGRSRQPISIFQIFQGTLGISLSLYQKRASMMYCTFSAKIVSEEMYAPIIRNLNSPIFFLDPGGCRKNCENSLEHKTVRYIAVRYPYRNKKERDSRERFESDRKDGIPLNCNLPDSNHTT